MMDIREKLVELLQYAKQVEVNECKKHYHCVGCPVENRCCEGICHDLLCADYLIANGVTVQEWIPVTERYPDKEDANEFDEVLTFLRNGKRTTYPYYMVNSNSNSFLYWMPLSALPQPPKGE